MTAKQKRPRWKQRLLEWLLSPKELAWLQEGEQNVHQIHSELYKIFNWLKWLKEYTDTVANEAEANRFLALEAWLATRQEFEEDLDPEEQEELQRQLERQMEEQEWMRRLGMDEMYEA
ncbi:MAG TPA: hypothetical protein PKY88_12305, partial [Anaerohalosphaeraceae bacterium]|nr:hypothetical protein [Anaerohalosphaeraceae bacterium]